MLDLVDGVSGHQSYELGPVVSEFQQLSDRARAALYSRYNTDQPTVRYVLERDVNDSLAVLNNYGCDYQFVVLDGRRLTPHLHNLRDSAGSSIVKVVWKGVMHAGELVSIFRHRQDGFGDSSLFAEVRWMIEVPERRLVDDPWRDLYVYLLFGLSIHLISQMTHATGGTYHYLAPSLR